MMHPGRIDRRNLHDALPALRRWNDEGGEGRFVPIASPARIYRPERELQPARAIALHTVTTCAFDAGELDCEATGVFGPFGHTFYVSPRATYVWLDDWSRAADSRRAPAMAYRLPLDGGPPAAIGVRGSPIDQFSFLESEDGHLNVVVAHGAGQWMWGAERGQGAIELLRLPVSSFGDGSRDAEQRWYRELPDAPGRGTIQNRFIGEHLLLGAGAGWRRPDALEDARMLVVRWRDGTSRSLNLAHPVDRLEPLGADALVAGADSRDLHFTTISLARQPRVADRFTLRDATQGETRSHGFFYRADSRDGGVLGLPVRGGGRPGYEHLVAGSAAILFLRNDALRLEQLGSLAAHAVSTRGRDDGCVASCVDWYGNARPLFVGERIFALLGYEIVEGALRDGRLAELRRVTFEPRIARAPQP
jgi:hypothetical protein